MHVYLHICVRDFRDDRVAPQKSQAALPVVDERLLFPRLSCAAYAVPLAFSHARARARTRVHKPYKPLVTHPCHCHRLLRSSEWTKVGGTPFSCPRNQ